MTDDHNEKIVNAARARQQGMDEEQQEALQERLEEFDDWYATCPKCHKKCTGTLEQMRAHKCQDR